MSEKYEFIAAERVQNRANDVDDAPSLKQMFTWLGVSKSGYYEWRVRPPSATAVRREELKLKIEGLFRLQQPDLRVPAYPRRTGPLRGAGRPRTGP